MMTIQELLALREGKSLKVYKDYLGKHTAGIGHLLTQDGTTSAISLNFLSVIFVSAQVYNLAISLSSFNRDSFSESDIKFESILPVRGSLNNY